MTRTERQEVREKLRKAIDRMGELLQRAEANGGAMSAEEDQEYEQLHKDAETMNGQLDDCNRQLDRQAERRETLDRVRSFDAPAPMRLDPAAAMREGVPQMLQEEPWNEPSSRYLGLSGRDVRRYSLGNVVRGILDGGNFRKAGLEMEASEEMRRRFPWLQERGGFHIPEEVLERRLPRLTETRDIDVAAGAALTSETFLTMSYVEQFWSRMAITPGARVMSGLVGTQKIPREATAPQATWHGETSAVAKSEPTWNQITLEPHRLSLMMAYTGLLGASTPIDIESRLIAIMAKSTSRGLERAWYHGFGADSPTGILSWNPTAKTYAVLSNIGHVQANSSANAGGALGYASVIEPMLTKLASEDADVGDICWIMHPRTASKARGVFRAPGTDTPLYDWMGPNAMMMGYKAKTTTLIQTALKKGTSAANLSPLILVSLGFVILARFVGTSFILDYTTNKATNTPEIAMHEYCDADMEHLEAVVVCPDLTP